MTYLERLKKSKTPTMGTVLAAISPTKDPWGSYGSSDFARFQKIQKPYDSKDSSDVGRFQKIDTPALPAFCRSYCPGLEFINMQNEGPVAGCLDPHDPNHWRRLDRLTSCPARKPVVSQPLPEWCSSRCEDFSQTALPNGQIMRKCWRRELGRRSGLLHTTGCPVKGQGKR